MEGDLTKQAAEKPEAIGNYRSRCLETKTQTKPAPNFYTEMSQFHCCYQNESDKN